MADFSPKLAGADAARLLQATLDELSAIKKSIAQPFQSKANIESQLARLEGGIRQKANELLISSQTQSRETSSHSPPSLTFKPKARASSSPRSLPPVPQATAYSLGSSLLLSDPLAHPPSDATRSYLETRFGIPSPQTKPNPSETDLLSTTQRLAQGATTIPPTTQRLAQGATTIPPMILPASIRNDPHATVLPRLTDQELHKGLMHLVNKGLLPANVDLTPVLVGGAAGGGGLGISRGDTAPMQASGSLLHEYSRQFVRPPPTTALEDSLLAASAGAFKLDLMTPSSYITAPPASPSYSTGGRQGRSQRKASDEPLVLRSLEQQQRREAEGETSRRSTAHDAIASPTKPSTDAAPARPFEALMDSFSLHEFMIRMGQALTSTPEFESFKRSYEPLWEPISVLISQLESTLSRYAIPLAIIDGKSLAELARGVLETERPPLIQDLFLCIRNIQEVSLLLRQPGRRFLGVTGKENAVIKIQSAWRGILSRRKNSKQGMAAVKIQSAWRSHRLKQSLGDKLLEARKDRDSRFNQLQSRLVHQWPLMQRHSHVVIHIPSTHRGRRIPTGLAQSEALLALESSQLARLCDLSSPLVEVLLLLPGPPDPDVLSYWNKILQVGGAEDPAGRYRVIYPENHARLPSHLSITAKMLASPGAIKRLKNAVAGRMAYLVPGAMVSDEEVDLCVKINAPLLGATPGASRVVSRKSGARALLLSSGVRVLPGMNIAAKSAVRAEAEAAASAKDGDGVIPLRSNTEFTFVNGEIVVIEPSDATNSSHHHSSATSTFVPSKTQYEEDEMRVLLVIGEAMVRSPLVNKWLIKIDDEVMGCGIASFDTKSIKGVPDILNRLVMEKQRETTLSPPAPAPEEVGALPSLSEPEQVAKYRLNEFLYRQLPKQLALPASKDVLYPTYRDFISAVADKGGVVEAFPDGVVTGSPRAEIFVTPGPRASPTPEIKLLSTHERILVAPHRAVGATFPQLSAPHRALYDAAMSVGAACVRSGIVGHVVVDFVTSRSGSARNMMDGSGPLKIWAVDVTLGLTTSSLSYRLFDLLSGGSWDEKSGKYLVEEVEDVEEDREASQATREGGEAEASSSHQAADASHSSPRFYFSLDAVTHPGISSSPCAKFFQRCWQEGLYFDVDTRVGVTLNLCDKYISGVMGMIAVGPCLPKAYAEMFRLLSLVSLRQKEVAEAALGHPNAQRHLGSGATLNLGDELMPYKDIQLLVKFMFEASN